MSFSVTIDQNPYLPEGPQEVHAIVTVESTGSAVRAATAEVIIIDNSGSMSGSCIYAAKQAAKIAVATIRNGVEFAVVAGHDQAKMIYPRTDRLAVMNDRVRAEAKAAIGKVV